MDMKYLNDIIISMSSAFNTSPETVESDSIDDISEDKTLKWRGLQNNQYASLKRKNAKKISSNITAAGKVGREIAENSSSLENHEHEHNPKKFNKDKKHQYQQQHQQQEQQREEEQQQQQQQQHSEQLPKKKDENKNKLNKQMKNEKLYVNSKFWKVDGKSSRKKYREEIHTTSSLLKKRGRKKGRKVVDGINTALTISSTNKKQKILLDAKIKKIKRIKKKLILNDNLKTNTNDVVHVKEASLNFLDKKTSIKETDTTSQLLNKVPKKKVQTDINTQVILTNNNNNNEENNENISEKMVINASESSNDVHFDSKRNGGDDGNDKILIEDAGKSIRHKSPKDDESGNNSKIALRRSKRISRSGGSLVNFEDTISDDAGSKSDKILDTETNNKMSPDVTTKIDEKFENKTGINTNANASTDDCDLSDKSAIEINLEKRRLSRDDQNISNSSKTALRRSKRFSHSNGNLPINLDENITDESTNLSDKLLEINDNDKLILDNKIANDGVDDETITVDSIENGIYLSSEKNYEEFRIEVKPTRGRPPIKDDQKNLNNNLNFKPRRSKRLSHSCGNLPVSIDDHVTDQNTINQSNSNLDYYNDNSKSIREKLTESQKSSKSTRRTKQLKNECDQMQQTKNNVDDSGRPNVFEPTPAILSNQLEDKIDQQTGKEIKDSINQNEKIGVTSTTPTTPITVTTSRPFRQIKPTAKLLENTKLRHKLESRSSFRFAMSQNMFPMLAELEKPKKVKNQNVSSATTSSSPTKSTKTITQTTLTANDMDVSLKIGNLSQNITSSSQNDRPTFAHLEWINDKCSYLRALGLKISSAGHLVHLDEGDQSVPPKRVKIDDKLTVIKIANTNDSKSPSKGKLSSTGISNIKEENSLLLSNKQGNMLIPHSKQGDRMNSTYKQAKSIVSNNKQGHRGISSSRHANLTMLNNKQSSFVPCNKPSNASILGNKLTNKKMFCLCEGDTKEFLSDVENITRCNAVDNVNGALIGCYNKIEVEHCKLFRPSYRVQYMALCRDHIKRLRCHNCCSLCGIFCTEGKFMLCKFRHIFHFNCAKQFAQPNESGHLPTVFKCPHCGNDESNKVTAVTMKCRNVPVFSVTQIPTLVENLQQNPCEINVGRTPSLVNLLDDQNLQHNKLDSLAKDITSAVYADDLQTVAEIIIAGFDLTSKISEFLGGTCLHGAANFGTKAMACLLLYRMPYSEFVNAADIEQKTALMCCILQDKFDIIKLLITCGADVKIKGPDGMNCLHIAAKCGNFAAAQLILNTYKENTNENDLKNYLDETDDKGWTAVFWAAECGHMDILCMLLNFGADRNVRDKSQNTALHKATSANRFHVANLLLQENINHSVQNEDGDTPLHIACRQSNKSLAFLLIANGADLMIRNKAEQYPLDCTSMQNPELIRIVYFNMRMRSREESRLHTKIVCSDISKGKELYPIQMIRRDSSDTNEPILPNFKYVVKSIYQEEAINVDYSITKMQVCSCNEGCYSDDCLCVSLMGHHWYQSDGRLSSEFNFYKPPDIFECSDICGCNILTCRNRVVQNGMKVPLEVFECECSLKGWGVRPLIPILCGTFICEYTGEILTDEEADRRKDDSYLFDLGSKFSIDAQYYGNVSRFINHSCYPNVVALRVFFEHHDIRYPKIGFFARRDIAALEELAFDYGDKFWTVKAKSFPCSCQSSMCRYSSVNDDDESQSS